MTHLITWKRFQFEQTNKKKSFFVAKRETFINRNQK